MYNNSTADILPQIKNFWRSEFSDWSIREIFWISSVFISVTALSIIVDGFQDGMALVSSLTGISYTLLAGKGKSSCYIFGAVNVILYGIICYQTKVYGDMLLNLAYYLPMQIAGFFLWLRNRDACTGTIIRRKLSWPVRGYFLAGTLFLWEAGAYLLGMAEDPSPWLDSATTVISIASMLLGVMRCFEQWIGWSLVNGISVIMWIGLWHSGNGSFATVLMWSIFFICGIVFAVQWHRAGTGSTAG